MKAVLAIAPASRGFGFVVLGMDRQAIDWGTKDVRKDKHATSVAKAIELLESHQPTTLVIEDWYSSRRCERIKKLLRAFARAASTQGVAVARLSRDEVRGRFADLGAGTNSEIALAVARLIPDFRSIPRPRKPWQSELYSMAMFYAGALAVSYLSDHED